MTDEQKQKRRDYQREYIKNMTDEEKQKLKDYRREYYKKYYSVKKLNNENDDNENDENKNDFITS